MTTWSIRTCLPLATALVALATTGIRANVTWDGFSGFVPAEVVINVGETVYWVNNDELFPVQVTSDADILDPNYFSFILAEFEESQGITFNNPGTYGYHSTYDDLGTVVVNPPTVMTNIALSAPRVAGGQFLFDAIGLTIGKTNVVQASTNLTNWTASQTNVATSASTTVTNAVGSGPRFYRVFEMR